MIEISRIERGNRKTLAVSISSSGEVVVKAPLRLSNEAIQKFLIEKQVWIESKLKKIASVNNNFQSIINYEELLVLGIRYKGFSSSAVSKITLKEDKILIPAKITPDKLHKKVLSWYKKLSDKILIGRTEQIAQAISLHPKSVKCTGSRGRWGACNSNHEVFLNWRCVMLPKGLIDYVIVHELVHLLELNHSPNFWAKISQILPDFKARRKEIKQYGFLLKLF